MGSITTLGGCIASRGSLLVEGTSHCKFTVRLETSEGMLRPLQGAPIHFKRLISEAQKIIVCSTENTSSPATSARDRSEPRYNIP
jgi:hypothetical protein